MITNLAADVEAFTSNVFLCDGEIRALVDVGNDFDVVARLLDHVDDLDVVALTHTHPDHVGTLPAVRDRLDVEVSAYDEAFDGVDRGLDDGETITLGDAEYEVLYTPGHEPNHCCFYAREAGVLFAGDLVFADGAFGRTDLEGADRETLIRSIDRVLDVADEDLEVMYPGHGRAVTDDPYRHVEMAGQAARF